jgi:hypothetical protein
VTVLGCAWALAAHLFQAPLALACLRAEPVLFQHAQHASAPDDDTAEGPSPFRGVSALSYRIEATRCSHGSCTESSCGDSGVLLLRFQPPSEASAGELGYRVIWLGPELPQALRAQLDRVMPLDASTQSLALELGWSGVTQLEGELALVAVDRAGKESEPSEAVRVSWSGCTEYFDDPFCAEGGRMPQADADADPSCAIVNGPQAGLPSPLAAAFALTLCAALGWRRKRSS